MTALGFATKLHDGVGSGWLDPYGAAVLYEVFWILCALWVRPGLGRGRVAVAVLLATSALECLQLSDAAPLVAIRSTFLGRTLIGTSFDPLDFPHYAVGCALGWWLAGRLYGPWAASAARTR